MVTVSVAVISVAAMGIGGLAVYLVSGHQVWVRSDSPKRPGGVGVKPTAVGLPQNYNLPLLQTGCT